MRISDWSSDVCSSDLLVGLQRRAAVIDVGTVASEHRDQNRNQNQDRQIFFHRDIPPTHAGKASMIALFRNPGTSHRRGDRSEEHTSELQSLMRISYAVFCLKKTIYHTKINLYT